MEDAKKNVDISHRIPARKEERGDYHSFPKLHQDDIGCLPSNRLENTDFSPFLLAQA